MKYLAYCLMFISVTNTYFISYIYLITILISILILYFPIIKKIEILLIIILIGVELKVLGII